MASNLQNLEESDRLQPSQQQLDTALLSARTYWHSLAEQSRVDHHHGIPKLDFRCIIARVPAIPIESVCTYRVVGLTRALSLKSSSIWRVTAGNDECGIDGKEKHIESNMRIGVQTATRVTLSGDCFANWPQDRLRGRASNYIAILTLAWSYILSARMVELQGHNGACTFYTNSIATGFHGIGGGMSPEGITINLNKTTKASARWWAAILAPKQGWRAIISQEEEIYEAPWAISLEETGPTTIMWEEIDSSSFECTDICPPSASAALQILTEFSISRNLESQLTAALAVALTLPTHNCYDITARLPRPVHDAENGSEYRESNPEEWIATEEELSHFMSLSCNVDVVLSSLCAMFWEEDIPCNLVSPWLHPILYEVPRAKYTAIYPGYYHEILCLICALRCPSIYPLWIGAALSGLIPKVLSLVESGMPVLNPTAFPWTACPQSFMDITPFGLYCNSFSEDVTRADAWRIRYLPPTTDDGLKYGSPPFTPWKPVGKTKWWNCELRVQTHRQCERHYLLYCGWIWLLTDGRVKFDDDFTLMQISSPPQACPKLQPDIDFSALPLLSDQTASQNASRSVFQWTTINGEGVPQEMVYHDEWLVGFLQEDSDSSLAETFQESESLEPDPLHCYQRDTTASHCERNQLMSEWIDSICV